MGKFIPTNPKVEHNLHTMGPTLLGVHPMVPGEWIIKRSEVWNFWCVKLPFNMAMFGGGTSKQYLIMHPGKCSWNPKKEEVDRKMIFLFNWVILRFHLIFFYFLVYLKKIRISCQSVSFFHRDL